MNDICKNTELFVNILGMSRTSAVQQWDHEAFQRAFKWANYFEQVYRKTKSKPLIMEKIIKQLEIVCSDADIKLGLSTLTFQDLPKSSLILRKNLLENPYLSNEFYLELIGLCNKDTEAQDNYKSQLHSLSKLKATLQILQLVQKRFEVLAVKDGDSGISEATGCSSTSEDHQQLSANCEDDNTASINITKGHMTANAILLRKCLNNVFNQDCLTPEKMRQLHIKLANMVKHDRGIDVLLYALVVEVSAPEDDKISQYIIEFIEEILLEAWKDNWKYFLQLPIQKLLAKCSSMYPKFLQLYKNMLEYCGNHLHKAITKNNYELNMEKSGCERDEQMHKYYYYLLQKFFEALTQITPDCEYHVEALIRQQCESIPNDANKDTHVWKKLSHDLMVSTSI